MKLTKLAKSPIQRVLVFGPPKSGKTELTTGLTKEYNLVYFGLENGHAVFYKLPIEQQERVEIVNLPDTKSYPIAVETMLKVIKGNKTSICDTHGKVECSACKAANLKEADSATFTTVELNALGEDTIVIIDSLTQFTNSAIAHVTKGKDEDYKLDYDDWGNVGKLMEMFLSHIQQSKFHCICISHETEAELEDGKKRIVPVAGTRNFSRNSAKYFDHVVYAVVANMKHNFNSMTTSVNGVMVGSRTDIDVSKLNGSLLPIFNGKMPPVPEKASIPNKSSGEIAASGLAGLLKK